MESYILNLKHIERFNHENVYDRMRIPMIIVCFGIIIYVTTKKNTSKDGLNIDELEEETKQKLKEFLITEKLNNLDMEKEKDKGKKPKGESARKTHI